MYEKNTNFLTFKLQNVTIKIYNIYYLKYNRYIDIWIYCELNWLGPIEIN